MRSRLYLLIEFNHIFSGFEGFVPEGFRSLSAELGRDISQGCVTVLSDFGRQIVFDFQSGQQG